MPESVDQGGAVRGPAPQGSINVARTGFGPMTVALMRSVDGEKTPDTTAPPSLQSGENNVVSLDLDAQHALRAVLVNANRELAEAYSSHEKHEKRLERVCSNLLISGERIPALDQPSFTMMQEAYLNASTAVVVASEKIIIMQELVSRHEQQLRKLICSGGQNPQEYHRAA